MENQNNKQAEALGQLKQYIIQQIQAGLQPDEIHTQLKQAGWQDDMVQSAFALVQESIVPQKDPTLTPGTVARGRFKTGWLLFKQSWKVLKGNKGLTRYIVMSFVASLLLTIVFAVIFYAGQQVLVQVSPADNTGNSSATLTAAGYVVAFLYYILAYFIVNLYAAGLVAHVIDIFHGKSGSYRTYMNVAWSKGGTLFMFSLIEATIGLILRAIAERSRMLGAIISWILGAIWSLARLFVVPIIVTSEDGAVTSVKKSTQLLVSTWGENLVGRVSLGGVGVIIFLLVLLPLSIAILVGCAFLGGAIGDILGVILVVLLYLVFNIIMSTVSSVLNTALFYFAQYKQIPAAFDPTLINSVFIQKSRRGIFGFGRKTDS